MTGNAFSANSVFSRSLMIAVKDPVLYTSRDFAQLQFRNCAK